MNITTYNVPVVGQSNGFGFAKLPFDGPLPEGPTEYMQNGFYRKTVDANGTVRSSDASVNVFNQAGRPTKKFQLEPQLAASLRGVLGTPADIINIINCSASATSSVAWANGLGVTPVSLTSQTFIQVASLRIREAMRIQNSVLAGVVLYQGESNAQGIAGAGPAEYIANWTAILDWLVAHFTFAADLRFVQVKLPLPVPVDIPFPNWVPVRDAQDALQASRSDMVTIEADSTTTVPTEDYHLQTPSLRETARRIAAAFVTFGLQRPLLA